MTMEEKWKISIYEDTVNAVNAKVISPDAMNTDEFIELQEEVIEIKKKYDGKWDKIQQRKS
jgi:hypothetical protein